MKSLKVTREATLLIIFSVLICDCVGLVCIKLGSESPSVLVNPAPEGEAASSLHPCHCTHKDTDGRKKCTKDELSEYKAFIHDMEKPTGISYCCIHASKKEKLLMESHKENAEIVNGSCETHKVNGHKQKTFYVIDKKTKTKSLCHCHSKSSDTLCARLPGRDPCDLHCVSELSKLKHKAASTCCHT